MTSRAKREWCDLDGWGEGGITFLHFSHYGNTIISVKQGQKKKPFENLTVKTSNCIQLNFQHATLPVPGTKANLMLTDVETPGLVLSITISKSLGIF